MNAILSLCLTRSEIRVASGLFPSDSKCLCRIQDNMCSLDGCHFAKKIMQMRKNSILLHFLFQKCFLEGWKNGAAERKKTAFLIVILLIDKASIADSLRKQTNDRHKTKRKLRAVVFYL